MAEENENIIEEVSSDTTEQIEQPSETVVDQPRDEKGQFKSKFESAGDDSVIKVDLSKPPTQESEEVKEKPAEEEKTDIIEDTKSETQTEAIPESPIQEEKETIEEQPVIEEVTIDDLKEPEVTEEKIEEAVAEAEATGKPLPESVQKLVDFM